MNRRLRVGLVSPFVVAGAMIFASCSSEKHGDSSAPAMAPTVIPAARKDYAETTSGDTDPTPAKPISLNRAVGTMRAQVTYPVRDRKSGYGQATRIRVWVGERLAVDTVENARPMGLYPATLEGGRRVLLLDTFSGGAHCCMGTAVLATTGDRRRASVTKSDWGNVGDALLASADRSGSVFLSADDASSYAFSSFAASKFPIKIVSFRAGHFVDVTDAYPDLIRRDAARHWREYLAAGANESRDPALVAYLADEYRLGDARPAWARVRKVRGKAHAFYAKALVWLNENGYVRGSKTRPGA